MRLFIGWLYSSLRCLQLCDCDDCNEMTVWMKYWNSFHVMLSNLPYCIWYTLEKKNAWLFSNQIKKKFALLSFNLSRDDGLFCDELFPISYTVCRESKGHQFSHSFCFQQTIYNHYKSVRLIYMVAVWKKVKSDLDFFFFVVVAM